jgi:hypothetical protein
MINAYSDILSYSGDEWEDFLTKICLIDIFKDLIPLFKDKEALTQAIRYIVMCYSKDSDCVILGTDWVSNKKRIFDKVLIHKDYYPDLVLLENGIVIKAIQRWLSFQDSAVYSQLIMLKDLQQEMQDSANSSIKKANLEIDYDQKFKNAKYVNELKIMIDDLEQELIQNNPKLKEATKELSKAKAKNTLGLEAFVN